MREVRGYQRQRIAARYFSRVDNFQGHQYWYAGWKFDAAEPFAVQVILRLALAIGDGIALGDCQVVFGNSKSLQAGRAATVCW